MNLSEEIKATIKKEATQTNKMAIEYLIGVLMLSLFFYGIALGFKVVGEPFKNIAPFFMIGVLLSFMSFKGYFNIKVSLEEESLIKWYKSLPGDSLLVKKIDSLIREKCESEKEIIYLKGYKIQNKSGKRRLLFVKDGKEMTFPLNEVEYDEGEKRIELQVSDRDWTVNIQKGTWINVQIYNV